MIERREIQPLFRLRGTIIDIETIGDFNIEYPSTDSRYYENLQPTIFGYLTKDYMMQYCAEGENEINKLTRIMAEEPLDEPYFALNTRFERHFLINYSNRDLWINDVRMGMRGSKWEIRERLGIPTYDDPFNGDSSKCDTQWVKGDYSSCINHNRACLLIERDILYRRLLDKK